MVCMARYFEDSAKKKRPHNNIFPLKKVAKKFSNGILFKIVKILNNFLLDSSAYSASFAWFGGGVAIAIGVEDSYFFPLTYAVIWFTLKFFKKSEWLKFCFLYRVTQSLKIRLRLHWCFDKAFRQKFVSYHSRKDSLKEMFLVRLKVYYVKYHYNITI